MHRYVDTDDLPTQSCALQQWFIGVPGVNGFHRCPAGGWANTAPPKSPKLETSIILAELRWPSSAALRRNATALMQGITNSHQPTVIKGRQFNHSSG